MATANNYNFMQEVYSDRWAVELEIGRFAKSSPAATMTVARIYSHSKISPRAVERHEKGLEKRYPGLPVTERKRRVRSDIVRCTNVSITLGDKYRVRLKLDYASGDYIPLYEYLELYSFVTRQSTENTTF